MKIGSSLDDYLEQEGILEECENNVKKKLLNSDEKMDKILTLAVQWLMGNRPDDLDDWVGVRVPTNDSCYFTISGYSEDNLNMERHYLVKEPSSFITLRFSADDIINSPGTSDLPEPPDFPLMRIIREFDLIIFGTLVCPDCGSSMNSKFIFWSTGKCIQPECRNYYRKMIEPESEWDRS